MTTTVFYKTSFALSLAGTIFAGYLSLYRYFSGSCAFNEPCPTFLGYPSCWFGFGLFAILLATSAAGLADASARTRLIRPLLGTSTAGVLFAGWFTAREVFGWLSGAGVRYALGAPTCAYGLVFFAAVAILSFRELKRA